MLDRQEDRDRVAALSPVFEQLVTQHTPGLIRTLSFIVLDREAASEIAQEAFIQLYLHWHEVVNHPNVKGWIYRVALNRAKDFKRSLTRGMRLIERAGNSLPPAEPVEPWMPDAELIDVLRGLPGKQRTAVALHYVGDLSVPEVARVMHISEGAAKSHLYRARLALKDIMEKDYE